MIEESNASEPLMRYRNTISCHQNQRGCVFFGIIVVGTFQADHEVTGIEMARLQLKLLLNGTGEYPSCHVKREGTIRGGEAERIEG